MLGAGPANAITGGDVTPDGTAAVVRTYGSVKVFARLNGTKLWSAVVGSPSSCNAPVPAEVQGEAVGFSPDGKSITTVSEGSGQFLHRSSVP